MESIVNHIAHEKAKVIPQIGIIGIGGLGYSKSRILLSLAHSGLPNSCVIAKQPTIEMGIKPVEQTISGFAQMCKQTHLSFVFLDEALNRLSKSRRKNEIGIYPALKRGKKNRKPKLRMLLPCFQIKS